MANTLKRTTGQATTAGSSVFTVPASTRVTIIGIRCSNIDQSSEHWVEVTVGGTFISGREVPLPVGSAIDFLVGSKIVAEAGDEIIVYGDTDLDVDSYISYLEQT